LYSPCQREAPRVIFVERGVLWTIYISFL
jgi:hypothetical protein